MPEELSPSASRDRIGAVLIGRNEGQRLVRCIESIVGRVATVVYVDSGSTDDSCDQARRRSVEVVELDMSRPFTAARGRNEGFGQLMERHPDTEFVQFVDGDCEVREGWIEKAAGLLADQEDVVAVCGYRRERFPEKTLYNTVCDVEWRLSPAGDAAAFGGDVMIRARALRDVGGYDEAVIAAEDDEVSIRLRAGGGRIVLLDAESTLHDADIRRASQWWRRAVRCGHGYAQVFGLHGGPPEFYFARNVKRVWAWGIVGPLGIPLIGVLTGGLGWVLVLIYPVQMARLAWRTRRSGYTWRESGAWGVSCLLSQIPEALGMGRYHWNRLLRRRSEIIEYK